MRFWLITLGVVILDQLSKWAIKTYMAVGQSVPLVKGFLSLTYVQNQGAAFGMLQGKTIFLLLCSVAVLATVIIMNWRRSLPPAWQMLTGLVAGGAAGNLIDRLGRGYVVDFLDLGWWPVFNVADSALCCAVVFILILSLREETGEVFRG
ncbi:MAG: signal peptidase II [Syntrophomonadaceae bacterium]